MSTLDTTMYLGSLLGAAQPGRDYDEYPYSYMGRKNHEWRELPAGDGPVSVRRLAIALRVGPKKIDAAIAAGHIQTCTVTTTTAHSTTTTTMVPRAEAIRLTNAFLPYLRKLDDWWIRHPGAPFSTGCSEEEHRKHQDERYDLDTELCAIYANLGI